ncbi:MAG: hypothetical protein K2M51_02460 [Helicobacter sp.]|nr:hypothetical protein [Helicobacter sp.]
MADEQLPQESQNENSDGQRMYNDYVKEVNIRLKSNQEAQDKMVLTISVAFLGLWQFLIEKLPLDINSYIVLFFLISNALMIVCTTLSFVLGNIGMQEDMKFVKAYYETKNKKWLKKETCYTKVARRCNYISAIFLVVAGICFSRMLWITFLIRS